MIPKRSLFLTTIFPNSSEYNKYNLLFNLIFSFFPHTSRYATTIGHTRDKLLLHLFSHLFVHRNNAKHHHAFFARLVVLNCRLFGTAMISFNPFLSLSLSPSLSLPLSIDKIRPRTRRRTMQFSFRASNELSTYIEHTYTQGRGKNVATITKFQSRQIPEKSRCGRGKSSRVLVAEQCLMKGYFSPVPPLHRRE